MVLFTCLSGLCANMNRTYRWVDIWGRISGAWVKAVTLNEVLQESVFSFTVYLALWTVDKYLTDIV